MNNIPAGYQINFITWENDLDARAVVIWSGIESAHDVEFLLYIADKFKYNGGFGLGNRSASADTIIGLIEDAFKKFPNVSDDMRLLFDNVRDDEEDKEQLADQWYDILIEKMLNEPADQFFLDQRRFCRCFDSATVYYFAHPVLDVTPTFR